MMVSSGSLAAQQPAATHGVPVVSQATLDSIDAIIDSILPPVRISQRVTTRLITRSYAVGTRDVSELASPIQYSVSGERWRVRVNGLPVRYEGPGATISGTAPISFRADFRLRPGDTLTVVGQTGSSPSQLDSVQSLALAAVGTSTLDLAAAGVAQPGQIGARGSFAIPLGSLTVNVRAGLDFQSAPVGTSDVYYRGTTVRGGLGIWGYVGSTRLAANAEVTNSSADSLGGHNLFPGGGTLSFDGSATVPLDSAGRADLQLYGFYTTPIGASRTDQPNRLIPIGDLWGSFATLYIPLGRGITLIPTGSVLRETSSATAETVNRLVTVRDAITGSGWAASGGIGVQLRLLPWLAVTPEVGGVTGNVRSNTSTAVLRRGRPAVTLPTSSSSPTSGWWASAELSFLF